MNFRRSGTATFCVKCLFKILNKTEKLKKAIFGKSEFA